MIRRNARRSGFTLVEMMVVTAIVALLVALLGAGLQRVRLAGQRLADQNDIRQLGSAIGEFQQKMKVEYIPSRLRLYEDLNLYNTSAAGLEADSLFWLESCWPGLRIDPNTNKRPTVDWNGDKSISTTYVDLEGPEVLVFALGGINYPGLGYSGFSTNSKNPAAGPPTQSEQRIGPFVTFDTRRLVLLPGRSGNWTYMAYNNVWKTKAQPYAYFSNYGKLNGYNRYGTTTSDCASLAGGQLYPYKMPTGNKYWNENSFQIISAGEDGVFGAFGPNMSWPPSSGNGDDDAANFARGILSSGSGN